MPSEKEIESTEKLLRIIRDDDTARAGSQGAPRGVGSAPKVAGAPPSMPPLSGGKKSCLAVSIGRQALLIAVTSSQKGRPAFHDLRSFPYPPDLVPESTAFPSFLDSCIRKVSPSVKPDIWIFISTDQVDYSSIKLPNVSAKDLHQTIYWAVKKEKKFNESTHIFDYRVLDKVMDKGVEKRLAVYFLVPVAEVESLQKLFRQAGHTLAGISIEPLGLQNYFAAQWIMETKNVVAHLQLGDENSRINILDQGRLLLSRSIKSGANSFVEAIQEGVKGETEPPAAKESPAEATPVVEGSVEVTSSFLETHAATPVEPVAEARIVAQTVDAPMRIDAKACFLSSIKAHYSRSALPAGCPSSEAMLGMLMPALERLIRQLERTLEYYVNNLGFQPAEKIYISGIPALFPGLRDYLANQFTIPVELFDPLESEAVPGTGNLLANTMTRMELLPVAGLALSDNARTMNMLHTYVHRTQERRDSLVSMAVACMSLILVAVVFGFFLHKSATLRGLNELIRAEEARLEALSIYPDPQAAQAFFSEVKEKDAKLKEYLDRYRPVAAIGALSSVTPAWARLRSVELDYAPEVEGAEGLAGEGVEGAEGFAGEGSVKGLISGPVETLDAYLGSYMVMLGDSNVFAEPRLISKSQAGRTAGESGLDFHVSFKLR